MTAAALRTARVPAPLAGRHRVRPALEHWLADADLARHGLPPQAILLARRLRTGWGELVAGDPHSRYRSLGALVDGASRPARGEAGGDAVWFADEAELLACLASDSIAGALAWHWWWRLVLRAPGAPAARERWCASARSVPQALARMDAQEARSWIASWPAGELALLRLALAREFVMAPQVLQLPGERAGGAEGAALQPAAQPRRRPSPVERGAQAAEDLYHLMLALARDPLAASTPVPVRTGRARRFRTRSAAPQVTARASPGTHVPHPPVQMQSAAGDRGEGPVALALPAAQGAPSATSLARVTPADAMASTDAAGENVHAPVAPAPRSSRASEAMLPAAMPMAPAASPNARPFEDPPAPRWISTGFGGLLFLLNPALELGLYGDFTQPRHAGLACSPWRFLLAAGRALGGRSFARDALADWLHARDATRQAPTSPPWIARCTAVLRADCDRHAIALQRPSRRPWPWLRARLAHALAVPERSVAACLLRLPARLHDQGERLDVHLLLGDLPLAARLAGLDRDPGWIPAAACDLRFHFD